MSIASPQTFLEWKKNQDEIVNSVLKNNKLPVPTDYPFLSSQSTDYTEMIKAAVVGGLSMIPEVGPLLSTIVDSVWSHLISNGTDQNSELWSTFSAMIKNTIDTEIEIYDKENVNEVIKNCKTLIGDFYEARAAFLLKKDASHKREVFKSYDDCMDAIRRILEDDGILLRDSHCAQELAAFSVMATTYMLLLKDGILNGFSWGITIEKISSYSTTYSGAIEKYKKHIILSFRKGCDMIRNTPNITAVEKFNRLMSYRAHCTIYCFDYLNIWDGFDKTQYPKGVYFDNVRYVWSSVVGEPVDTSQYVTEADPYYTNSLDFLEQRFIDKEYDHYRKELKRVTFNYDSYSIYGMQQFHKDPAQVNSNGEHVGELIGNQYKKKGEINTKTIEYTIPSNATKSSFNSSFDIQPRSINLSQASPNTPIDLGDSPKTNHRYSRLYKIQTINHVPIHITSCEFQNHKIGTIRGGDINTEVYTNGASENDYCSGVLDSFMVGFVPVNIFNENYLQDKVSTIVNVQKYWNRSESVSFHRDHYFLSMHSLCIPTDGSLIYRFNFIDQAVQNYSIKVRYHCDTNPPAKLIIRNANGANIGVPIPLSNCYVDGTYFADTQEEIIGNEYIISETRNINFSKFANKQINLIAKPGPIFIQSIIFTPIILPA